MAKTKKKPDIELSPAVPDLSHIAEGLRHLAVPIDTLNHDPTNARLHGEQNLDAIKASLARFGQDQPLVVQETGLIVRKGNGRLAAARALGWTHIAALVLNDSDWEGVARGLADNRTAELATWDVPVLARLMSELQAHGVRNDDLGWTPKEIGAITFAGQEPVAEPVPGAGGDEHDTSKDAPVRATLGDLWRIDGKHYVICGDATDVRVVGKLLQGKKPFIMVTDPPYGVNYDAGWREEYDDRWRYATGKVENDNVVDWTAAWKLFTGDVIYCWHAGIHSGTVQQNLLDAGFVVRSQIIWNKPVFVFGRGHYHWKHEPCFYAVRPGTTAHFTDDRTQSTVWDIAGLGVAKQSDDEGDARTFHSTQKPIECMARPIRNHGKPGDIVYDPFLGSGTTLIAAHRHNRLCYGCELNPKYVDVILQRAVAEGLKVEKV